MTEIVTDIRKLYEDDELSLRQIARIVKLHPSTVSKLLDCQGVRRRQVGWSRSHEGNPNVGWPNARKLNAKSPDSGF